jgi:hypothetical protein
MGIMTRRQGDVFVIASDRTADGASTKRAPARLSEIYQVWTGAGWSADMAEAISFDSMDTADEYVRANYTKVTG